MDYYRASSLKQLSAGTHAPVHVDMSLHSDNFSDSNQRYVFNHNVNKDCFENLCIYNVQCSYEHLFLNFNHTLYSGSEKTIFVKISPYNLFIKTTRT
jgi:hypothetical protein